MILRPKLQKGLIETLVSNLFKFLLILFFLANCSLNKNSKFWSNENIKKEDNVEQVFTKEESLQLEVNVNTKISLYSKPINKSFFYNQDNNNGRINYDGDLKTISKFKFSKIENFHQYDPSIVFDEDSVIFFDNKGSILKFDQKFKLIWKKNY